MRKFNTPKSTVSKIVSGASCLLVLLFSQPVFSQFTTVPVCSGALTDIRMVSASVGYAGGVDGIFKTIDGGKTWNLSPYFVSTYQSPDSIYFKSMNDQHFEFVNANVGYSVGWGATGNYEQIVKTVDGGVTWQLQHLENPDKSSFQPLELRLQDVHAFNENIVITVGYRGRILKTVDGGQHWEVKNSTIMNNLNAISFSDDSNGIAVGEKVVLHTTDGGETWTATDVNFTITDVYMFTASEVIAITDEGYILKSFDGGVTWSANVFKHSASLHRLSFVSPDLGFVAGNGIILKTTDRGAHFEQYPLNNFDFTAIHAWSPTEIYLATAKGQILRPTSAPIFYPIVLFEADKDNFCFVAGETTVNFTNLGSPVYNYEWRVNDVLMSKQYNFSYNFPSSGTYQVSLTTAGFGHVMTIFINPQPSFSTDFPTVIFPNDTLELNTPFTILLRSFDGSYYVTRDGIQITEKRSITYWDYPNYIEFNMPAMGAGEYLYKVIREASNLCGVATQEKEYKSLVINTPLAPSALHLSHVKGNHAKLSWSSRSKQASAFVIQRRESGASDFVSIAEIPLQYPFEYVDATSLKDNQQYEYRILAKNSFGLSVPSSIATIFIHGPVIFVNSTATGNNTGSSWQNAITDLGKAFRESTEDKEIWIAKGVYYASTDAPWAVIASAVYGGFAGNEQSSDQRDWNKNKVIFSGDAGVKGDVTDNATAVLAGKGKFSGVTISGGREFGMQGSGIIDHCTIENNKIGINGEFQISKSIIRNNQTGVLSNWRGYAVLMNSFIYNNSEYGLDASEGHSTVAHCLFYANTKGSVIARYLNLPNETQNTFFGCVFGHRKDELPAFDYFSRSFMAYDCFIPIGPFNIYATGSFSENYDMSYMAGDDGILGNDDDLLYFPEPTFVDKGVIRTLEFPGFYNSLDEDALGNKRVQSQTIDRGPVEYTPETPNLPDLKTKYDPGVVSLSWKAIDDPGVTRIWLEKKLWDSDVSFIPLNPGDTTYADVNFKAFSEYHYRLRVQKGNRVSFPGTYATVSTYPPLDVTLTAVNSKMVKISYKYRFKEHPISNMIVARAVGSPKDFQWIGNTMNGMAMPDSSIFDYVDGETIYYNIIIQYEEDGIGYYSADTLSITRQPNTAPTIVGQLPITIAPGNNFFMNSNYLTVVDDYNSNFRLTLSPGENYTVAGNWIYPTTGFAGTLKVSVTAIDDEGLESNAYVIDIVVKENMKPVITGQIDIAIVENHSLAFVPSTMITVTDDNNFPNGMLVDFQDGANYSITGGIIQPATAFHGELSIPLRISDTDKVSDWFTLKVKVDELITVDFTADNTVIYAQKAVNFFSTISGNPTTMHWTFDGGNPAESFAANPENITYATPGTYKVGLSVANDLQSVVVNKENYITVNLVTGIHDVSVGGQLDIFPIPSTGVITVKSAERIASVSLSDLLGHEVKPSEVVQKDLEVKMTLLPGQYILRVKIGEKVVARLVTIR